MWGLLTALQALADAATPTKVVEAGMQVERHLFDEVSTAGYSWEVLDLVLRALALTGLIPLSMKLFDGMMTQTQSSTIDVTIPSYTTQEVLCHNLRKLGRLSLLQHVLQSMKTLCTQHSPRRSDSSGLDRPAIMSTVAYNMILAAHCDPILHPNHLNWGLHPRECLESAYQQLCAGTYPSVSPLMPALRLVEPDAVSFATLLQACAKAGNHSLANTIWRVMVDQGVAPNVVAYNARLELAAQDPLVRSQAARDQLVLDIWTNLTATVQPDKYSVDWILLPLIRSDQLLRMEGVLNDFVAENSQAVASQAFTAFLTTLVKAGYHRDAERMFDRYIRRSLSPVISGSIGTIRIVRPTAQHFNVLLTGYQQQHHEKLQLETNRLDASSTTSTLTSLPPAGGDASGVKAIMDSVPYKKARELYHTMQASQDCRPNAITRTILLSMCRTSDEIVEMVNESLQFDPSSGELRLDASVLRGAMMAAGKLGDASAAGWLYANLAGPASVKDDDIRMWNVLVGALAQSDAFAWKNGRRDSHSLDLEACATAHRERLAEASSTNHPPIDLHRLIDGRTVVGAFRRYLEQVNDASSDEHRAFPPRPNSQTYCIIASVFQRRCPGAGIATALFRNATKSGVSVDGRFANAAVRCFGSDLHNAIDYWKREIRPAVIAHDASRSPARARRPSGAHPAAAINAAPAGGGRSLAAAYHGLLHVCGRAGVPQMALRVVYAMRRDGLEPDETALNCYRSGKFDRQQRLSAGVDSNEPSRAFGGGDDDGGGAARRALQRLAYRLLPKGGGGNPSSRSNNGPYESLLYVECTQYNQNDRRRAGEQRVRIIV